MNPIPIYLAVEDNLSDAVIRKTLQSCVKDYAVAPTLGKRGSGHLKSRIQSYNLAAKHSPFLVVTDLDTAPCPAFLISSWLPNEQHHNLLLRIAVREVEAWIISDRVNFSAFLGISQSMIPTDIEALIDPKEVLITLARKSPKRSLREDLVPAAGSTARIGPNYNSRLSQFIYTQWNPNGASASSRSLRQAIHRLNTFTPLWP